MKTVFRLLVLVFCLMVPEVSSAQVEQQEDPFGSLLYTPEEIMQHRRAIDLDWRPVEKPRIP